MYLAIKISRNTVETSKIISHLTTFISIFLFKVVTGIFLDFFPTFPTLDLSLVLSNCSGLNFL